MIDMNIREFYVKNYPTDDLGIGINPKATFAGLLNQLIVGGDVYEYIYVYDSIIRERLFEQLAKELEVGYEYVYKLWLNN
jgi:hypothetical protein